MAKPTKPTAPLPALRSQPDTFSERFENWIIYSINTFPDYADAIADFADQQGDEALAAAVAAAAGNLSDAQRALFAGGVVGISEATGNPLEAVDIVEIEAATTAQAQAGTATGAYMDPALTKAAIDAQVPLIAPAQSYELLSRTVIAGNPATIEFTYNGNLYDAIVFKLGNVRMGADIRALQMRTSSNSGASFNDGASDYAMQGSSASAGTSQISVSSANMGLAGAEAGFSGEVTIYGPDIALRTGIDISGSFWDNAGNFEKTSTSASRLANAVVNAVQFLSNGTGGFTNGGVITMYGVRNS